MRWFLLALALCWPAYAHDWMPLESRWCCNQRDCLPHPRSAIDRTPDGWVIKRTGQLFPNGSDKVYPNPRTDLGEVWICHMPTEPQARCIFVLPEGS